VEGRLRPALPAEIDELWQEHWGLPIDGVEREYLPADVEGLIWDVDGTPQGLVTWWLDGDQGEVVSINAFEPGVHIGGRLLDAAEAELAKLGVRRVRIVTTNDNLRALAFYVRRGYRLVQLHLGSMDRVRAKKPDVPELGNEGIPLRDMWELEKVL
jgi:GNAT superfamily N-acetyltransferase